MENKKLSELLRPVIESIRDEHEKGTKDYATADITLMHEDLGRAIHNLCDPTFTFSLDEETCVALDNTLREILNTLNDLVTKYVKKENNENE